MKKSLPCFAVLVAVAAANVALAESEPFPSGKGQVATGDSPVRGEDAVRKATPAAATGNDLLVQAANQLERRASVSARLRHQLAVGGQELYGVGSYWQQGSGDELKIRLELQIAGQEAKLLQVSNSRFLWIDRRLPTGRSITRFDLRQLRADPSLAPPDLDKLDPGKANWSTVQSMLTAHSGGLPSLLAALGENFSFLPPQAMRLAIEPAGGDAQPTTVPVWAVVGQWKPEKLAELLTKEEETTAASDAPRKSKTRSKPQKSCSLPDRLPQEVLLLVGQADLFPYRVEYRNLETPVTTGSEGPPIPYQLSVHPLVVLELSDVVFDATLADGQFDFDAGGADWVDQTAVLLERLHRDQQAKVATRSVGQNATPAR